MNDKQTTVSDLKNLIDQFSKERNWHSSENAKNLAMAMVVESSELLEIFQWVHSDDAYGLKDDEAKFEHLKEEIADVFWYLTRICNHYGIDLSEAVADKKIKNAKKYPPKDIK